MKKKAAIFCIALIGMGAAYCGYRLDRARDGLEQYKTEFGYDTPTEGLADCVFENSNWKAMLIDAAIACTDGAHNIKPYDIDGDGILELVANSFRSDTLMTYEHRSAECSPSRGHWAREVIDPRVGGGLPLRPVGPQTKAFIKQMVLGTYTEGAHYTAIGDVSGDGRSDLVVAGDLTRYDVVWYEAVSSPGAAPSWKKRVAYRNDSHRTYHVELGDIDGDGDRDIVFCTKTDHSLGWLENRRTPGPWPMVMLDTDCIRCFYARAMDADRDGRTEIIASADDWRGAGGKMHLYKHSGNPSVAGDWRRYDIARCPPGHGISVFVVTDMDGDGASEIVGAGHQGDVVVLKNPYPGSACGLWETSHVRNASIQGGRSFRDIDVGDIDLDGDLDIVVADEAQNAILWFENPGETFCGVWRQHMVDQSHVYLRWCHCVKLGDIDGDGDLDMAVAAAGSNVFLLYLNRLIPEPGMQVAASFRQ